MPGLPGPRGVPVARQDPGVTADDGPAFRPLFDAHVELAGIRSLGRTPLGEPRIIAIGIGARLPRAVPRRVLEVR
jgi:hypothetical protein